MFQLGFDTTDYTRIGIGDCLGCEDCSGTCRELLEMVVLPDLLLEKTRNTN